MWKETQSMGPQQRYVGQKGGDLGEGRRGREGGQTLRRRPLVVRSFTGGTLSLESPHFPDGELRPLEQRLPTSQTSWATSGPRTTSWRPLL